LLVGYRSLSKDVKSALHWCASQYNAICS
jgi:hypothetical protein